MSRNRDFSKQIRRLQKPEKIEIKAATVVVSMEKAESYYRDEIANEGSLGNCSPPIIMLPQEEAAGKVNDKWLSDIYEQLKEVRSLGLVKPFCLEDGYNIDIGLVDIQIIFHGSPKQIHSSLRTNPNLFFEKNARHLDLLSQGSIHDQMFLILAFHSLTPQGASLFHYHNVIFGLRKEKNLVGYLNFEDLLSKLDRRTKIGFVA